ncbi:type IV pilin protein [Proteocatella sphenisci]|uniref:type IV pilin protein n=1 Tax=Proteocatella sphenisci TaxID=181070 RepID=UPI00048B0809|nr:type II secretion system protein [Proteocatella sphenisci]
MRKHRNKDKGFTLIEIMVTTTIIAMLAAFAIPTFIGYIESGNQTKRMNIAKTIYISAQDQLTEKKINNTLEDFSMTSAEADVKFGKDSTFVKPSEFASKVSAEVNSVPILPTVMPEGEKANIVYISKPQGLDSGKVYDFLDSVIQDKSVLNNAILIEYNKTTGFVLSVFYSEEESLDFTYEKPEADNISKYMSVNGGRPYSFADERRQGYCGIEETGMLPPSNESVIINIRDGKNTPLDTISSDGKVVEYENVLYAEALIPDKLLTEDEEFKFQVLSDKGEVLKTKALEDYETESLSIKKLESTLIPNVILTKNAFNKDGISYSKVIWVLDYVNGNMLDQSSSIGLKIDPQNIRAGIVGTGIDAKSLSIQHSHFSHEIKTTDYIKSARHLNNVRYKLGGDFRQLNDIDMGSSTETKITNFLPIGTKDTPFKGKYFGRNDKGTYAINNLIIDVSKIASFDNVGLFGAVQGSTPLDWPKGVITGLSIMNPSVKGHNNVGVLAGSNSGQVSMITVQNNNLITTDKPMVQGSGSSIGGIIGENSGVLSKLNLINKNEDRATLVKGTGYYVGGIVGSSSGKISDVVVLSASSEAVAISDVSNHTHTGGIAGQSSANMDRVMYLAVAPKFGASGSEKIAPIAGVNSGTVKDAVYLSGEAIRPTPITAPSDNSYNILESNIGTPESTKTIYQNELWSGWENTKGITNTLDKSFLVEYPYPYNFELPYKDSDITKNWPVVDENGGVASLAYYELYSDNTWGYSNSTKEPIRTSESLEKDGKDITVINDGYCLEYFKTNARYEVNVGVRTLTSSDWKWNDNIINHTQNLSPVGFTKEIDGKVKPYVRLFLNNSILESQANGASVMDITLIKGSTEILKTSFNPLFAPTVAEGGYNVRSPRQLDNVDNADDKNFVQPINIDFGIYEKSDSELTIDKKAKIYARELASVNYVKKEYVLDSKTRISKNESIVKGKQKNGNSSNFSDGPFSGSYDGNKKYIKNVRVYGENSAKNIGLFSEISGKVQNVILLESYFEGKQYLGGIASTVSEGGLISNCQLSNVVIKNNDTGSGKSMGGVVGENNGTIENVYFNSTYREAGIYSSPIIVAKSNTNGVGGIVGTNKGMISNAYTTAVGPNARPTIGTGNKNNETNIYYLKGNGYNDASDASQGVGMTSGELAKAIGIEAGKLDPEIWESATIVNTKETVVLKGQAYPFPKLIGMNHYFDWPVLTNSLKYYEKYSNGKFGYFYYIDKNTRADSLEYNPDLTVVEEGYLVELMSSGKYYLRFDSDENKVIDKFTEVYDNRNVIKLKPSEVEELIDTTKFTEGGVNPVKIEVSSSSDAGINGFANILSGIDTGENIYFNPLFAKQIFIASTPLPQKTLELRSPRQVLNVKQETGNETSTSTSKNNENNYYKVKPSRQNKIYLNQISTKFPYGNSEDSPVRGPSTFKFEDSYNDSTSYYGKRDFDYKIVPAYNVSEILSTDITVDSNGKETVTEVTENFKVETEIHRYEIKKLSKNVAKKDSSYWELISETEYRTNVIKITTVTKYESKPVKYNLKQTININFGGADGKTVIDGMPIYNWETGYNDNKAKIPNNIISELISDYDAGVYYNDGKYYGDEPNSIPVTGSDERSKRNRIYNLVMNVKSQGSTAPYALNTGGAFGTVKKGTTVKNIEFVDPQIRYDKNGRGGGIVTNTNLGIIDNVQVYNEYKHSLFADENGSTGSTFCYSLKEKENTKESDNELNGYGHNHGGIAGQSAGPDSKITNCIVGTNSNNIKGITEDQKTTIECHQDKGYDGEWATNRIGGIVGFVYGKSKIIACTNIAKIDAWYNSADKTNMGSPYAVGGIAGAVGLRDNTPQVSYLKGYNKPSPGDITEHIIGCYNSGSIKLVNGWVAGIVGYPATGSQIISCYNTGRINIERNSSGELVQTSFSGTQPIRIGGIAGETDGTSIKNCYNVGYLSGNVTSALNSAAGAIMALPAYSNTILENSYSLAADKYRPVAIVGKLWDVKAKVNGYSKLKELEDNFQTWESRANLRNNKELTSEKYLSLFPALDDSYRVYKVGDAKNYPVFTSSPDSFYIYPQLTLFNYSGVNYKNPHITPWEYIDSEYDATLIYYEKYNDGKLGYYNIDINGNAQDNLLTDKLVVEDGYCVDIGKKGIYRILINDKTFYLDAEPISGDDGISRIYITEDMLSEANGGLGYNKIRVHTMLSEDTKNSSQNLKNQEDNKLNRLIGCNTYDGATSGRDIYFDSMFPKEIKYDDINIDKSTLKLVKEAYYIRSPRHLDNISRLTQAVVLGGSTENRTIGRDFIQELDLDFANYVTTSKSFATISDSVVRGEFAGSYDGNKRSISGLDITGNESSNVGLFQSIIKGSTVENLRILNPIYNGTGTNGILNIGAIAAENSGTIQNVAVETPVINGGLVSGITKNAGGISGTNSGSIKNVYIISINEESPIKASGEKTNIGGITGINSGEIDKVLYLAVAPSEDSKIYPIVAVNKVKENIKNSITDAYFLSGDSYNVVTGTDTVGIAKSTSLFSEEFASDSIPFKIINWYEWSAAVNPYPYPFITGIRPPQTFPTAE